MSRCKVPQILNPQHCIEVNGQVQVPATLPPGWKSPVSMGYSGPNSRSGCGTVSGNLNHGLQPVVSLPPGLSKIYSSPHSTFASTVSINVFKTACPFCLFPTGDQHSSICRALSSPQEGRWRNRHQLQTLIFRLRRLQLTICTGD